MNFGAEIRKDFVLDSKTIFVNHASCGALPLSVYNHRLGLVQKMESSPDVWFRLKSESMWKESIDAVAEFLGSKPSNLVFVKSTTVGVNAVLRSLKLGRGDSILISSWSYFAVKDTCHELERQQGIEILYVDIPYPLKSKEQLLELYETMLQKHSSICLVLLDVITSVPPVLLPIKQLIAVCRKYGKLVLVDGAHVPGHVEANLEDLGADFFTGNLYKWAFAPRDCAVLWIHEKFHGGIMPPVTGYSFYGEGEMWRNYLYQGHGDFTPFYTVGRAIDFYRGIGGREGILEYCSSLVTKAADLLVARLRTFHYPLPKDMQTPLMRQVALPKLRKYPPVIVPPGEVKRTIHNMMTLMEDVLNRFGIMCAFVSVDNQVWIRLCASVYNEMSDYEQLAVAIATLVEEDAEN